MRNKKLTFIISVFIIISLCSVLLYTNEPSVCDLTITDALNTVSDISVIDEKSEKIAYECRDIVYRYDSLLSVTNSESDLYKINSSKSGAMVSDEVLYILSECEKFYHDTDKRFDVTGGALYELWNVAIKNSYLPSESSISDIKQISGFEYIELDFKNSTIYKKNPDLKINFGAVAKGYIADEISEYIKSENPRGALINLGGNVYAYGKNQNNKPWNIGIKDPNDNLSILGSIKASDKFVITSGNYERFMEIESGRYHHIIDATTGYPAESGLKSVTIISDNGMLADILSTSCFLVGLEKSKNLIEIYNASAIFVTDDNLIYYSEDLENDFIKLNENYTYKKLQ